MRKLSHYTRNIACIVNTAVWAALELWQPEGLQLQMHVQWLTTRYFWKLDGRGLLSIVGFPTGDASPHIEDIPSDPRWHWHS